MGAESSEILNLSIYAGVFNTDAGIKLGVDGEAYPRIWLTPQGLVLVGDGTAPPLPITGGGGLTEPQAQVLIDASLDALKAGVPAAGDTLAELYTLITGLDAELAAAVVDITTLIDGLAAVDLTKVNKAGDNMTGALRTQAGILADTAGHATLVNGYKGMAVVSPPADDDAVVGLVIKAPDSTWGIGQDYAEGNFIVTLSAAANTPDEIGNVLKTISATTDSTPVQITTSTAHGLETGDVVRISNTGIPALDGVAGLGKFFQISVNGASTFTLNDTAAPGASAVVGYAFTDRSGVLNRVALSGLGTISAHFAPGLRAGVGQESAGQAGWFQPFTDATGVIIDNVPATIWPATLTRDALTIRDNRSSPARLLVRSTADGIFALRSKSGKSTGTDRVLRIHGDADTEVAYITATGIIGGIRANLTQTDNAQVVLQVQGAAGQTAALQRWYNSAGALLSSIQPDGTLILAPGTVSAPAIGITGDSTTGFYWASAGSMWYTSVGVAKISFGSNLGLASGVNIALTTASGSQIGTTSSQKLAFYGATPVARPVGVAVTAAGIHAALVTLGLIGA